MSRPVSPAAVTALDADTVAQTARVTFYKSRMFFEAAALTSHAPAWVATQEAAGTVIPEAFAYSTTLAKTLTVLVQPSDGHIAIFVGDSVSPVVTSLVAHLDSRPGIWEDKLYFFEEGTGWKRATLDLAALNAGNADCITALDNYWGDPDYLSTVPGAIYPVSATECVILAIDEGAIRPVFVSPGETMKAPARFFNPTIAMKDTEPAHMLLLHESGAAKLGNVVCVYQSMNNGRVEGIRLTLNGDSTGGVWSDVFTAIPQDLSEFKIGNVFTANNRIFLCGNFLRTDDFASTYKYTFLTWSTDGITFSMDRRVLVSYIGYRFLCALGGLTAYFSSCQRFTSQLASYQLVGESAPSSNYGLVNLSGNTEAFTANVEAGGETCFDDPIVDTGTFCKLETGIQIAGPTTEWVTYHEAVLADYNFDVTDGGRQAVLEIVPDALWHIQAMTHPYYMEFQGREVIVDKAIDFSNLYKVDDCAGSRKTSLAVDFWNGAGQTGLGGHEANIGTDVYTLDLNQKVSKEFPVFGNDAYYDVHVFGWSRAGHEVPDAGYSDPTPTTSLNDQVDVILVVQNAQGSYNYLRSTAAMLQSTYNRFPQSWHTDAVNPGSNPVIYRFPNPGPGSKLVRIGVRLTSPATGATIFEIERVEMPKIVVDPPIENDVGFTAPAHTGETDWVLGAEISNGVIAATEENGILISGLQIGQPYALESFGGLWYADSNHSGGGSRRWVVSNDTAPTGIDQPPWYGGIYYEYPGGSRGMTRPYWAGKIEVTEYLDDAPGLRNYRIYFKATSDHVYVKLAIADHSGCSYPGDSLSWRLSHAVAPTEMTYATPVTGSGLDNESQNVEVPLDIVWNGKPAENPNTDDMSFFGQYRFHDEFVYGQSDAVIYSDIPMEPGLSGSARVHSIGIHRSAEFGNVFVSGSEKVELFFWPTVFQQAQHIYFWYRLTAISGNGFLGCSGLTPTGGNGGSEYWGEFTPGLGGVSQFWSCSFNYDIGPHPVQGEWTIEAKFSLAPFVVSGSDTTENPVEVVPGTTPELADIIANLATVRKGAAEILFSTTPYNAWNFETVSRWQVAGDYGKVGNVGLATDGYNFLLGYVRKGYIGLEACQHGTFTTLQEISLPGGMDITTTVFLLRFTHRDGHFYVEVKAEGDPWPNRGAMIDFEWAGDTNGPIAVLDDLFHVGVFTKIDPPSFRTCGFKDSSSCIAMLPNPVDVDGLNGFAAFPSSGKVDIDGLVYRYSGKITGPRRGGMATIRGPFQVRNFSDWRQHNNPSDGYGPYPGKATDITWFDWLDDNSEHDRLNDLILGTDDGYSLQLENAEWRAWTRTGGQYVWLRNRVRLYAKNGEWGDYYASGSQKAWVTNGLSGVAPDSATVIDSSTGAVLSTGDHVIASHQEGAYVYIHSNDMITLLGFVGASGDEDQDLAFLLDKFCRIAGTRASFPSDVVVASQAISNGTEYTVQ